MVLFHETRPPRGSTSDATAPVVAAANKVVDVEAMITDIIIDKVLKELPGLALPLIEIVP